MTSPVDPAELASLPFGSRPTPHRLVQRFREGRWSEPEIEAAADLALPAQTRGLHYAQSVFEGFKAHRQADGGVALFRPQDHLARLERSASRLCLPPVDRVAVLEGIREVVSRDAAHVPAPPGSLYVRPLLFADDPDLLAWPGSRATLLVMCAPVPTYFDRPEGLRLRTETRHVRAFPGGTGSVKAAGNYAAAMLAQRAAREEGYDEVVWLDAVGRDAIEETGSMNLFVVHRGRLLTAPAGDTVLPGITRDSLLVLARDLGLEAREERIPLEPSFWREVTEVFSAGTAVGTAPIASIDHEGRPLFRRPAPETVQPRLARALFDLKEGRAPDPLGWRVECPLP